MRRLSLPRSGGERDTKGLAVSLGKNIKRLRTMVGLRTQKALTELLGIPQSQVSDWENNRYTVLEIYTLIKLAKVLHCSVDELLAGVDPDYDWIRQGGAVGAVPAERWPDIPVVAEGDTLPDGITWDERAQERPEVLWWLSRPGDLDDPKAYGIQIRGDSMLPAYRPNMIAIVSPELEVRAGDEVYVQLASGECLVRLLHTSRASCIPSFCQHQITPKTSRYTRCSMSMFPNVSINGRIRSSGQLGRWWYSISPCRNNECVRRFTVFAFNQRS